MIAQKHSALGIIERIMCLEGCFIEMCKGSDIGKFTGYYYTASMAAQIVTPVLAGTLMRLISYKVLFIYAAIFVLLSFITMTQVKHGDQKVEAKKGLAAYEDMED